MNLLSALFRIDVRRPASWLAAVGALLVAARLAAIPASGAAVAVGWMAGAALGVAAAIALIGGLMWVRIRPDDGLRSEREGGTVAP